jgi:hypothetical protein
MGNAFLVYQIFPTVNISWPAELENNFFRFLCIGRKYLYSFSFNCIKRLTYNFNYQIYIIFPQTCFSRNAESGTLRSREWDCTSRSLIYRSFILLRSLFLTTGSPDNTLVVVLPSSSPINLCY